MITLQYLLAITFLETGVSSNLYNTTDKFDNKQTLSKNCLRALWLRSDVESSDAEQSPLVLYEKPTQAGDSKYKMLANCWGETFTVMLKTK